MQEKMKKIISLQHNAELAFIFRQMADCYDYLGAEHRFRARAYDTAASVLANMKEPVDIYGDDVKALDELKGVGQSIAKKIIEYIHTGKIATYEKLKKQVPVQLLGLVQAEGIGPATIRQLHDALHISTPAQLAKAIEEGKINAIKGFAAKKTEKLREILKSDKEKRRIPLAEAEQMAKKILREINKIPFVEKATIAGSIRRKKETIGDIDIIILAQKKYQQRIIDQFTRLPLIEKVIVAGNTKASVLLYNHHIQVDIRVVEKDQYGSALFYFTGSKEHNIKLRITAKQRGWKMNEYGVFDIKTGKRLAGETEQGIYKLFGLSYIPPEKRLGGNELENAVLKKSPDAFR